MNGVLFESYKPHTQQLTSVHMLPQASDVAIASSSEYVSVVDVMRFQVVWWFFEENPIPGPARQPRKHGTGQGMELFEQVMT